MTIASAHAIESRCVCIDSFYFQWPHSHCFHLPISNSGFHYESQHIPQTSLPRSSWYSLLDYSIIDIQTCTAIKIWRKTRGKNFIHCRELSDFSYLKVIFLKVFLMQKSVLCFIHKLVWKSKLLWSTFCIMFYSLYLNDVQNKNDSNKFIQNEGFYFRQFGQQ